MSNEQLYETCLYKMILWERRESMDLKVDKGFDEMNFDEIVNTEGGLVLTTGAMIAIGCFAVGGIIGYAWAKSE